MICCNTSELAGNAVAAGISNLYYPPADRSFGKTANKWGQQIALDTFFNVAKEFGPTCATKCLGIEGVTLTPGEGSGAMESKEGHAEHATKTSLSRSSNSSIAVPDITRLGAEEI